MNFIDFVEMTGYSPTHVAHCLLYRPESRPVKIADSVGYKPAEVELARMRKLIAGRGTFAQIFGELKKAS